MSTADKYAALHQSFDEFLKVAEDAKKTLIDKLSIVSLRAKEFGFDLLSSKSTFLSEVSNYLCRMNSGILAPVIRFFMPKALDIIFTWALGSDWFNKLKSRVGICKISDNKLVEI